MTRRVVRIAAQVLPDQARLVADALTWSGTFHAIGARLLREYAEQIGLDRAFTIHDREDSADLINLVRTIWASQKPRNGFQPKALAFRSIRAPSMPKRRLMRSSRITFPGASDGRMNLKLYSAHTSRPSSGRTYSIMTIYCFTGHR
jgi:ATP-dependent DNA helicase UvrD/PcrA